MATSVQTTYSVNANAAYAGLIVRGDIVIPMFNSEASAEIPFGYAVKPGLTLDTALLPTANTSVIAGIVGRDHAHVPLVDLGTTGLKAGARMDVVVRGAMWVLAEDATTYLGRGYVRCTTGGDAAEIVGGITSAAESTETIDCTNQIVFQAAVAAQALVLVEVDFTNKPGI